MAVLAMEEFSGSPVENIHGRAVDGGGGTWDQIELGITGRHIAAAGGQAFGVTGGGSNRGFYRLIRSSGDWPADYKVTIQFSPGVTDFALGVRTTHVTTGTPFNNRVRGYVLRVFADSFYGVGDPIDMILETRNASSTPDLWEIFDDPAHTYLDVNTITLEVQGSTLRVLFNGTELFSGTDTTYTDPGYPLFQIFDESDGGEDVFGTTFSVPETQAEFNSLWSAGGDANVEWFVTSHDGRRLIYAHITGPMGVGSASSSRTRMLTGLAPSTEYQVVIPRLIRVCGIGEPTDSFHFENITTTMTTDGSGNLGPIVLEYEFNRAGQTWTLVSDGHTLIQVTGSDSVNDKGVGSVTMGGVLGTTVGAVQSLHHSHLTGLFNTNDPTLSDVWAFGLEHRTWSSRSGVYDFIEAYFADIFSFESGEHSAKEFVAYLHAEGSYFQGLDGVSIGGAAEGEGYDDDIAHEILDLIIGGDTFWGDIFVQRTDVTVSAGIDWFKVEDGEDCPTWPPWPPPPPPPPPVDDLINEWPMKLRAWRTPVVPSHPRRYNAYRVETPMPGVIGKWVMWLGAWREIIWFDGETIPEPDGDPPWHDPCNELPPVLPPGEVIPLVGRYFGMSNTPTSVMRSDFLNFTQRAVGNWTHADLAACVSKGLLLMGAQGGGSAIKLPGNVYDYDTFINGTIGKLDPLYSTLVAHTPNQFAGYSMADDLDSRSLWKPNGFPDADLATAVAFLRARYPGIRIGARVLPSQYSFDPGLQFYSAQYRGWGRGPAFDFGAQQYSIAASRSAFISLDLNYLHGGNGSSGIRYANGTALGQSEHNFICSPAEVVSYFTDMYDGVLSVDPTAQWLMGSKGYQFDPEFLEVPGMYDAMLTARNALASLPPP